MRYIIPTALIGIVALFGIQQFGAEAQVVATSTTLATIESEQASFLASDGTHVQVLKNNTYPAGESRTFAVNLPTGWWIDVYEAPQGKGYCVKYEDDTVLKRWGFGVATATCGATEYIKPLPPPCVSSSTSCE